SRRRRSLRIAGTRAGARRLQSREAHVTRISLADHRHAPDSEARSLAPRTAPNHPTGTNADRTALSGKAVTSRSGRRRGGGRRLGLGALTLGLGLLATLVALLRGGLLGIFGSVTDG